LVIVELRLLERWLVEAFGIILVSFHMHMVCGQLGNIQRVFTIYWMMSKLGCREVFGKYWMFQVNCRFVQKTHADTEEMEQGRGWVMTVWIQLIDETKGGGVSHHVPLHDMLP
jgi:hypothetical protein